jgi:hypothetical protein
MADVKVTETKEKKRNLQIAGTLIAKKKKKLQYY